jgi:hypothetical protein
MKLCGSKLLSDLLGVGAMGLCLHLLVQNTLHVKLVSPAYFAFYKKRDHACGLYSYIIHCLDRLVMSKVLDMSDEW